jgi:2,4-dienoyl-CoA reductase-like NADH-dependent reductase (Old Yellow Enzyme family)
MSLREVFNPLELARGPSLLNRVALAPLTNQQSNEDGTVSGHDIKWIELIANSGYGFVMTCAANVQANGKAFQGQLGIYDDRHLVGLKKIASALRKRAMVSSVQLHHGGMRSAFASRENRVGPTKNLMYESRALSNPEVKVLRDDFIHAAARAQIAGFDGVEVHAAFGWILTQFLSPVLNRRVDEYGGSFENRTRLLMEIISGIRAECRSDFQIGLRLSMERYGLELGEIVQLARLVIEEGEIDYLDLAPWNVNKVVEEGDFAGRRLIELFTEIPRNGVKLVVSGNILDASDLYDALNDGFDFVMVGRAAILEPRFPKLIQLDCNYKSPKTPVTTSYLEAQGLSDPFIEYMKNWDNFVR